MSKAIAKFNMKFNNGNFFKGESYNYNIIQKNPIYTIEIFTNENKKQLFTQTDFKTLFLIK